MASETLKCIEILNLIAVAHSRIESVSEGDLQWGFGGYEDYHSTAFYAVFWIDSLHIFSIQGVVFYP